MEPQVRLGLANLTKMAFEGIDLHPLRAQLLGQCLQQRDVDGAYMDLSVIEQLQGNRARGLEWQHKALERQRVFVTNRLETRQKTLLVFAEPSDMGGNTPIEFLLQESGFEILTYYPSFEAGEADRLPPHDIAFCAVPADSKAPEGFFENIRRLTRESGVKTLNLPGAFSLERDCLGGMFPQDVGLRFPKTQQVLRDAFEEALHHGRVEDILNAVGGYPFIIRPVGSHAGVGLAKVLSRVDLVTYLAQREETAFFVSEFINYASAEDGNFRKYRLVFVDGEAFPCHMAISTQWDLWYLNANMAESEEKRQEEAGFMEHFEQGFAARHRAGLAALMAGIDLAYFGIDCAEDAEGNLVVFEADNALIVHDMDCETLFGYKRKPMRRIFARFEKMLLTHCEPEGAGGSRAPSVARRAVN